MARRRVAVVVHSAHSPCRCHLAVGGALRPRGWTVRIVTVEDLPLALDALARADAVFEHADTVRGEGWLRAAVRAEAERVGARIVGSRAAAAALCDDKAAATAALAAAGVPVPPTAVLRRPGDRIPRRLRPPFVVKAGFEHGSRTLAPAATRAAARAEALDLVARGSPAVVQERIDGREIAVALAGRPLRALPPVEVLLGPPDAGGRAPLYTRARKWDDAPAIVPARLSPAEDRRVRAAALRAARALGASGYARVDLRLGARGLPFVLEVNARPSLEPGMEMARAAEAAGISLGEFVEGIAADAAATTPAPSRRAPPRGSGRFRPRRPARRRRPR